MRRLASFILECFRRRQFGKWGTAGSFQPHLEKYGFTFMPEMPHVPRRSRKVRTKTTNRAYEHRTRAFHSLFEANTTTFVHCAFASLQSFRFSKCTHSWCLYWSIQHMHVHTNFGGVHVLQPGIIIQQPSRIFGLPQSCIHVYSCACILTFNSMHLRSNIHELLSKFHPPRACMRTSTPSTRAKLTTLVLCPIKKTWND
jgi:hypothetical protein